jgi:hypothetical protein
MKKLILILVALMPVLLFAQIEGNGDNRVLDDQTKEWISKISSDSEMRGQMMKMMIEETKDNKEEMMKLVGLITGNAEMRKMIMETRSQNAHSESSLQFRKMDGDSVKMMQMERVKPVQKK